MHQFLLLFAQQKGPPPEAAAAAALVPIIAICCELVASLAGLAFVIYFLIILMKAFSAIAPRNRDMEPGMVFLVFIPVFGLVWQFLIVLRLASSLEKEFADRGMSAEGDFGKQLGLTYLILNLTCCLAPAGFVCMIMYMLRIKAITQKLESGKKGRRDLDDDD